MKHKEEKAQISTVVIATLEKVSSLRLVTTLPQLPLILPYFQCSVTLLQCQKEKAGYDLLKYC